MGKISCLMKKEFDSEPAYGDNDKYIKKYQTKMHHINNCH